LTSTNFLAFYQAHTSSKNHKVQRKLQQVQKVCLKV